MKEYVGSVKGLEGRSGFVPWQFQIRKLSVQLFPPELDLSGMRSIGNGLPLPQGEISILHAQIGRLRIAISGEGPIKRIQLIQHQADGQSIRNDVMQIDDQDAFLFTQLEQGDANQRKR